MFGVEGGSTLAVVGLLVLAQSVQVDSEMVG
jgi:hypothetical protein